MPEYLSLSNPGWKSIYGHFGVRDVGFRYPGNDLILPDDNVVVVISAKSERRIGALRWGLGQARLHVTEVQSRTIGVSTTYRSLLIRRRCVILADAFIEKQRHTKRLYRIRKVSKDGFFCLAGIYDVLISADGKHKRGMCSVVTCPANWAMLSYSDHMPVILDDEGESVWLERSVTNENVLMKQLRPYVGELDATPISKE